ncbi:hypothetical protein DB30_04871 [Enhygromyxa salina]|uniref:Uncharacterized protein n=1 Tax=Enhygromyxa salina TaxID=215803 RepID=A0A0C1ZY19_9BACT|nr:hypothetical protein [Enhygromyxa salina]KIG16153.1 hypothetical protein DB30_04871 [Enhygromyxa salina]
MARQWTSRGVGAALRRNCLARLDVERERLFDAFAKLGPARAETRVAGRLAGLPPIPALEQRLFDLWIAHITEPMRARSDDLIEHARALIQLTRSVLVTQRETDLDIRDSFEDDDFIKRKMTILVSGMCNCEMSNLIVWSGLRKLGHLAYFFETGLADQVGGSHLLLYAFDRQGSAFVDAWSDVPCFHLSDFVPELPSPRARYLASRFANRPPPGVPDRSALGHLGLHTHGLYPADAIRAGVIRPSPDDDEHPPASAALACVNEAVPTPAAAIWADYVALRRQHLEGQLEQPARAYEQFAARDGLSSNLKAVVAALAKRQTPPSQPA